VADPTTPNCLDSFVDTNVVVYAFGRTDAGTPSARALSECGAQLDVQVLNEFVNVASRKLRMPWGDIHDALRIIRIFAGPIHPLTSAVHEAGVAIAERYRYHIYDALIIAAAAEAGCRTLYSEDLAAGQTIKGVRIVDPFV